jgi:hypothetical protein
MADDDGIILTLGRLARTREALRLVLLNVDNEGEEEEAEDEEQDDDEDDTVLVAKGFLRKTRWYLGLGRGR